MSNSDKAFGPVPAGPLRDLSTNALGSTLRARRTTRDFSLLLGPSAMRLLSCPLSSPLADHSFRRCLPSLFLPQGASSGLRAKEVSSTDCACEGQIDALGPRLLASCLSTALSSNHCAYRTLYCGDTCAPRKEARAFVRWRCPLFLLSWSSVSASLIPLTPVPYDSSARRLRRCPTFLRLRSSPSRLRTPRSLGISLRTLPNEGSPSTAASLSP